MKPFSEMDQTEAVEFFKMLAGKEEWYRAFKDGAPRKADSDALSQKENEVLKNPTE